MEHHQHPRHDSGHDEEDLTHVQARMPVLDVVKDYIRKRFCIRNLVMGEGQADGGGYEATGQEQGTQEGFKIFIINRNTFRMGVVGFFCHISVWILAAFHWTFAGENQGGQLEGKTFNEQNLSNIATP